MVASHKVCRVLSYLHRLQTIGNTLNYSESPRSLLSFTYTWKPILFLIRTNPETMPGSVCSLLAYSFCSVSTPQPQCEAPWLHFPAMFAVVPRPRYMCWPFCLYLQASISNPVSTHSVFSSASKQILGMTAAVILLRNSLRTWPHSQL